MKSALYECGIVHERYTPRSHRFAYRVFFFSLDLSEIDALVRRIPWLSRNRFNLYSFHDRDHVAIGELLERHGIPAPHRIQLITNLRILGYVFNPASFYFCFDASGAPTAAVVEVNNTFGETKAYVIDAAELRHGRTFETTRSKEFYISPFVALDVNLRIRIAVPDERLGFVITDVGSDGETILQAAMTGRRVPLTALRLAWFGVKYPLLTVRVIASIHWQALRLWLKGTPFHRKSAGQHLQTGLIPRKETA
jgi:uncharacterized protein